MRVKWQNPPEQLRVLVRETKERDLPSRIPDFEIERRGGTDGDAGGRGRPRRAQGQPKTSGWNLDDPPHLARVTLWGEEGDPLGSHLPAVTAQTGNWRLLPIDVAPPA